MCWISFPPSGALSCRAGTVPLLCRVGLRRIEHFDGSWSWSWGTCGRRSCPRSRRPPPPHHLGMRINSHAKSQSQLKQAGKAGPRLKPSD